ncbi:TPA: hypothetical protein ACH3X3_001716 [Trebouxia sp. C0006]
MAQAARNIFPIPVQTLDSFRGRSKQSGDDSPQQLTIPPRLQLLPPPSLKGALKRGGSDPEEEEEEELSVLMQRIKAAKPPAEVLKVASREYRRLKKSNEHHPGYAMSRAYLETLADLPWNTFSGETQAPSIPEAPQDAKASSTEEASDADSMQTNTSRGDLSDGEPMAQATSEPTEFPRHAAQLSLHEARDLLDKDHYGLDKVKDRIVQYLAVRRLRGADARAPILCFVGPPGTGKTSLASSISKVLLRPFQRVSVGGVRDEAEIRGHRRTYIGAMPGRIIQAVRRSGVRDPVLLLDEVDKMGHDSLRGDPASALLEVLDPNQNQAFVDTYLSVPFDLSQVVFVATANQLQNMSAPLLDRLEIIQLSGYTLDEKRHIAQRHLIPGLLGEHGLSSDQLHFPAEAITLVADGYTREAGVRSLSRNLAAICRHVTVKIVSEQDSLHEQSATSSHPDDTNHDLPDQAPSVPNDHQHQHAAHHGGKQPSGTSHQQPLHTSVEPVRSAMEQELASPTTATSGGFFWGSLWGGLKGAFTPPRQHPSGRRHQLHHSKAVQRQSQTGQQTQHDGRRPAAPEVMHAAAEYASSGAPQQQAHSSKRIPHMRQSSSRTAGSSDGKKPLSNPYGGVNADMSRSGHTAVPCLTVTAELIEEVLGPRKYNETDSADSLVSPGSAAGLVWTAVGGQVQYVECCCTSTGQPQRPGKLVLTGQVGEVLQESAHLALSWIRSHTHQLAAAAAATSQSRPSSTTVPDQAQLRVAGDGDDATAEACTYQDVAQESGLHHPANLLSGSGDVAAGPAQQGLLSDRHQASWQTQVQASDQNQANCLSADDTHAGQSQGHRSWHTSQSAPMSLSALSHDAEEAEADTSSLHAVSAHGNASLGGVSTAAAQWDVHVHLPAGAVSKDGPSAGITLATAMVSLFLGRCVRGDTAMTGELTLRGLVLPIGGLKEKLLAAHHAGIKRVLVPKRNWRDVKADVPDNIRSSLEIIPVHVLEDVLYNAFDPPLVLKSIAKL